MEVRRRRAGWVLVFIIGISKSIEPGKVLPLIAGSWQGRDASGFNSRGSSRWSGTRRSDRKEPGGSRGIRGRGGDVRRFRPTQHQDIFGTYSGNVHDITELHKPHPRYPRKGQTPMVWPAYVKPDSLGEFPSHHLSARNFSRSG